MNRISPVDGQRFRNRVFPVRIFVDAVQKIWAVPAPERCEYVNIEAHQIEKDRVNHLLIALEIHHDWCAKYQPGYSETGADAVAYRATKKAIAIGKGEA